MSNLDQSLNQDYLKTKQYFLDDPLLRLINETKYYCDWIIATVTNSNLRTRLEKDLSSKNYDVSFSFKIDWIWDGHKNYSDEYVLVSSQIDSFEFWNIHNLIINSDHKGFFVQRRGISEFWKNPNPHKLYRILHISKDLKTLWLSDAKDSNGKWIATLAEYTQIYPNLIDCHSGCELTLEDGIYPDLVICPNDGKFLIY